MNKVYYSIKEVAEMLEVKSSVLRFWEREFKVLKPKRSKGGRRFYKENDIELLKKIKKLLYEDGLTIKGAKASLQKKHTTTSSIEKDKLKEIQGLLKEAKKILGGKY